MHYHSGLGPTCELTAMGNDMQACNLSWVHKWVRSKNKQLCHRLNGRCATCFAFKGRWAILMFTSAGFVPSSDCHVSRPHLAQSQPGRSVSPGGFQTQEKCSSITWIVSMAAMKKLTSSGLCIQACCEYSKTTMLPTPICSQQPTWRTCMHSLIECHDLLGHEPI